MTANQQLLIDVVRELGHPDAVEVFLNAKEKVPKIGSSTVYRNLAQLSSAGYLRRIPVNGEADRFDATLTPHEHVICRVCGHVRDIDINDEIAQIKRKAGGEDLSVEIILRETCRACTESATQSGAANDRDF